MWRICWRRAIARCSYGDSALKFMETNERPNIELQKALVRMVRTTSSVRSRERWRFLTGLPLRFCVLGREEASTTRRSWILSNSHVDFGVANIQPLLERYSEPLQSKRSSFRNISRRTCITILDSACLEGCSYLWRKPHKSGRSKVWRALQFA